MVEEKAERVKLLKRYEIDEGEGEDVHSIV